MTMLTTNNCQRRSSHSPYILELYIWKDFTYHTSTFKQTCLLFFLRCKSTDLNYLYSMLIWKMNWNDENWIWIGIHRNRIKWFHPFCHCRGSESLWMALFVCTLCTQTWHYDKIPNIPLLLSSSSSEQSKYNNSENDD